MAPASKRHSKSGKPLLSARRAAKILGCAPDYISRLCREDKLRGRQIERVWYVEPDSLAAFEKLREELKEVRAQELSRERRLEQTVRPARRFKLPSAAALIVGGVLLFGAVGSVAAHLAQPAESAAALAQVRSPFLGSD